MNTTTEARTEATTTGATSPIARRAAAALMGLLVLLAALAVQSAPAGAFNPTMPRAILAAGHTDFIRVYWAPPADDGGEPVTGYRVERLKDGVLNKAWNVATSAPLVDTTALDGVAYKYRVQAKNVDGVSAWSEQMGASLSPFQTEYFRFGTDVGHFVDEQYHDFLGRKPGIGERTTAVLNIKNGTLTTGAFIDQLVHRAERDGRHSVIRLYFAYFDRAPDHGGLDYWVNHLTAGTKGLNDVSGNFAGSNEFTTTYGALTNAQFVTLVYNNVLERNPEPAGLAYWTTKLDTKAATRGQVMTNFSESNEFEVKAKGRVLASDVYDAMIDTAPKGSELTLWSAHIQGGGNAGDYGTRTMMLNTYNQHKDT